MYIEFQIRTDAPAAAVEQVLDSLRGLSGVRSAVQAMPEARAPELRLVCVAEVEPAVAAAVLERLRADPAIDYAEGAPDRGLR